MKNPDDIWDDLGSLEEQDLLQAMTNLFSRYYARYERRPEDEEALRFFRYLDNAIEQANQCNLNRR